MADTKKNLEGLQIIVTDLAQQADGHAIQSKIFAAQGFSKLGEKYAEHAEEERGYVDKCIDRMKGTIRTIINICIIMLAVFLIIHRRVFSALLNGAPMPEALEWHKKCFSCGKEQK